MICRPPGLRLGIFAVILLLASPLWAGWNEHQQRLSLTGSLRTRYELWNWFDPGNLAGSHNNNNDNGFAATRLRLGLRYDTKNRFDAFVEAQNTAFLSLPDDAEAPAPQGNLGLGATHFSLHRREWDSRVFFHQLYLTLKAPERPATFLRVGRFEYLDGLEVLTGDPTLDWLKRTRLSQRLIGSFGFSHVGRSFDGIEGAYDHPRFNLTSMASHPRQGGFDIDGMDEIDAIDLLSATLTVKSSAWIPRSEGRLFYIYYGDDRGPAQRVTKVDNRPLGVRAQDRQDISFSSFGFHYLQAVPLGAGQGDMLAWGVYQTGEWGKLDHEAWAWTLEAGYQMPFLPWHPWLRAGYLRSSGDDNPQDRDHGTFFQILPTVRQYALFPFFNMMNSEDGFLQLLLRPIPQSLTLRTDLHFLRLSEAHDLWYQGAGAFQRRKSFGYVGQPSGGNRELATLWDLGVDWNPSPRWNVYAYYGHVFGGEVIRAIYEGRDADFGYVEVTLKF